ncbi:FecR family protein [Steroidobacter sp.]|uniref:FecR family protein n=1 Tax=Steroidobacter sp. TaxID=1978227 RepID=UPI001A512C99|nr:FecR domain-containing protein [Steroidobacter sp.]MBL8271473.1 FecR domain-containing protein [Steroidobacter sp.]
MSQMKDAATDEITARAAEWFEKHRDGGLSPAERESFAQWLNESPVHIREYLAVTDAWGGLQVAQPWPEESAEQLIAAARGSASVTSLTRGGLSTWKANRAARRSNRRRLSMPAMSAAAALAVVAIGLTVWIASPWSSNQRIVTARGEQRSIVLADGSVIQLNTLTRVRVRYEPDRRVIELPEGEAFFRVAADPQRPFEVVTPVGTVRAVGTEFNVYNHSGGMRVAVVEGKVQVAYAHPDASAGSSPGTVPVAAHESIEVRAGGKAVVAPSEQRVQLATAWMQRRLAFENERLDVIVSEFNRYNRQQMRIADQALLEYRINGVFNADDPGALTKYLQRLLNVEVETSSDNELVLRQKKAVSVF